jgi:hypothetical protein
VTPKAIKRTPAELISLDHYNSCNHCSDGDRGYCDEGVRLARLCAEVGQVCPNCEAMSEDGGLCWYCHDEQKRASVGQVTDTDSYRLGEISMKARLYLQCGGKDAYRELALALNRELDYLTPLPLEPVAK